MEINIHVKSWTEIDIYPEARRLKLTKLDTEFSVVDLSVDLLLAWYDLRSVIRLFSWTGERTGAELCSQLETEKSLKAIDTHLTIWRFS